MSLVTVHEHPDLDDPVLIVGLEGWIDAGMGAANAVQALLAQTDPQPLATFDADELLDFRARRPVMRLVNGLITSLDWSVTVLQAGTDAKGRDVVLLTGAEPDRLWHGFTDAVVQLALDLGVSTAVGLGAYPAPVPHTRDTRLAITTASRELNATMKGFVRGTVDVPAGIQTALEVALHEAGISAHGLWAQVPHYASGMPFPAASVALIEGLAGTVGLSFGLRDLADDAAANRVRLDELIAANAEYANLVRQLEMIHDAGDDDDDSAGAAEGFDDLPSGEELAAELQEYLRDLGGD